MFDDPHLTAITPANDTPTAPVLPLSRSALRRLDVHVGLPPGTLGRVLAVLEGGAVKHGPKAWQTRSWAYQADKARSHLDRAAPGVLDDESGEPHEVHAAARLLLAVALRQGDR